MSGGRAGGEPLRRNRAAATRVTNGSRLVVDVAEWARRFVRPLLATMWCPDVFRAGEDRRRPALEADHYMKMCSCTAAPVETCPTGAGALRVPGAVHSNLGSQKAQRASPARRANPGDS